MGLSCLALVRFSVSSSLRIRGHGSHVFVAAYPESYLFTVPLSGISCLGDLDTSEFVVVGFLGFRVAVGYAGFRDLAGSLYITV